MDADSDYYRLLGVPPSASARAIRLAYKSLAQRLHPDKAGGDAAEAAVRMAAINAAYRVLADPAQRAAYERQRAAHAPAAAEAPHGHPPREGPADGVRPDRPRRESVRSKPAQRTRRGRARRRRVGPSLFEQAAEQLVGCLVVTIMLAAVVLFVGLLVFDGPNELAQQNPELRR